MKRIIFITGATEGIGKATAMALARKDFQLVFVARNAQKAEAVKKEIITSTINPDVDYLIADLSSLRQVRQLAETFKNRFPHIDVLINNAGVCLPERRITEDGYEMMFQVNHLSHFLLTNLLLYEIKKSNKGRIVVVSSEGYNSGKFDLLNLQSEKKFGMFSTYCDTKLLNLLFALALAERLQSTGITVNALHPGVVRTQFGHEMGGVFKLMNAMIRPFLLTPEKCAATSVYLASSGEVENITDKYFKKCKPVDIKNAAITRENQEILWEKSLELSGLKM